MSAISEFGRANGEVAAINLESARRAAWTRFTQDPRLPGVAEAVVDIERLVAQFLGDLDALDRLEALALHTNRFHFFAPNRDCRRAPIGTRLLRSDLRCKRFGIIRFGTPVPNGRHRRPCFSGNLVRFAGLYWRRHRLRLN